MCRALKVLCVAGSREKLQELKRATVSAQWELTRGAVGEAEALAQLESERPHVMVLWVHVPGLAKRARELVPGIRIVSDRDVSGADAVVASLDEIRPLVVGLPRPGGPVS